VFDIWVIFLGYLLGSVPSAQTVARMAGDIDLRVEGDGKISAAAVYRRLGLVPFLIVVAMDVGKGALAVSSARLVSDSVAVRLASGVMAVVGHSWSPFLKFRGGLGATVIFGALAGLMIREFLIAGAMALVPFLVTRRSGLSTAIVVVALPAVLILEGQPWYVVTYPLGLICLMLLKKLQLRLTPSPYLSLKGEGEEKVKAADLSLKGEV
jgi:glycerol-3-phosphate acyltransferase PlsY